MRIIHLVNWKLKREVSELVLQENSAEIAECPTNS